MIIIIFELFFYFLFLNKSVRLIGRKICKYVNHLSSTFGTIHSFSEIIPGNTHKSKVVPRTQCPANLRHFRTKQLK